MRTSSMAPMVWSPGLWKRSRTKKAVASQLAERLPEAHKTAPSAFQRQLYYDCLTDSEAWWRFLLDHVGADRVVLGSDWPYVRWNPSPVAWVQGLRRRR